MHVRWRRITHIVVTTVAFFLIAATAAVAFAWVTYPRTWTRPLPATRTVADPSVVARGRYIVYGPGRCADCHAPDEAHAALERGEDVPLSGGSGEHTYLGHWSAPNLTPDRATGIGLVSDAQLARMMRYGVDRDGHAALPFMDAFADLTEDDLVAVLSFLRSQPPVAGLGPRADVTLLGRIALAYFVTPYGPSHVVRQSLAPAETPEYGAYVAETLAGCGACHTARNLRTGAYLSPRFSGGLAFASRLDPARMYVSPNLTPDPATGHMTGWTEDQFVARFRAGGILEDSPMPWSGFRRMTDVDLRALYLYLRQLPPVSHDVGPTSQPRRGTTAG